MKYLGQCQKFSPLCLRNSPRYTCNPKAYDHSARPQLCFRTTWFWLYHSFLLCTSLMFPKSNFQNLTFFFFGKCCRLKLALLTALWQEIGSFKWPLQMCGQGKPLCRLVSSQPTLLSRGTSLLSIQGLPARHRALFFSQTVVKHVD